MQDCFLFKLYVWIAIPQKKVWLSNVDLIWEYYELPLDMLCGLAWLFYTGAGVIADVITLIIAKAVMSSKHPIKIELVQFSRSEMYGCQWGLKV